MRIILLAPLTSSAADDSVIALQARGYDAINYYDLHKPEYPHNHGMRPSPRDVRRMLVLECLGTESALVVHPDCTEELLDQVLPVMQYLSVPVIRYDELRTTAPADSLASEVMDHLDRCALPARAILNLPLHQAGYRSGAVVELRTARGVIDRLKRYAATAEQRANRLLGHALKNPMARRAPVPAQRVAQAAARRYRTDVPLSTTG